MALTFDDRKLLPEGRIRLFRKLRDYLAAVKKAGCGTSVILDGSFVMGCVDEPSDIDLILILPPDWDVNADLKPFQYNLVSKRRVRREYRIDVIPVRAGSARARKDIKFFAGVSLRWCREFGWPVGSKKGLVRITL